jgi:hypothetical protein
MEGGFLIDAHSSQASSARVRKQSVAALLSLLAWAERQNFNLPTDLSKKHDEYLWERPKQEK